MMSIHKQHVHDSNIILIYAYHYSTYRTVGDSGIPIQYWILVALNLSDSIYRSISLRVEQEFAHGFARWFAQ
jgi:hypothetical protein